MRPRLTAISLLALCGLAASFQEERKEWGKREPVKPDVPNAKVEEVACPVCAAKVERVTFSEVKEFERDTDFKITRSSFNVYPYVLTTCPKCSYSTYSAQFHRPLDEEQRKAVTEALREMRKEYPDSWSVPISVSIRAAVTTHAALQSGEGTLFEIYLLGSYLAREAKAPEAERDMQRRAIENLTAAAEKDESYRRPKMLYLGGELSRRLELYPEALEWFAKAHRGAEQDLEKLITRQEQLTRDAMERRKPRK